jgi:hypothetical protein
VYVLLFLDATQTYPANGAAEHNSLS